VLNNDGSRPRHLRAVSAVEDSQSASPAKSTTDPTRRQGRQQPGRGSDGGDNKEGAQDPSSKGKQQSSSSSSTPKMEQMLNRVVQRLDKLELEKGQRQPAPPDMPRPPASAGGAAARGSRQASTFLNLVNRRSSTVRAVKLNGEAHFSATIAEKSVISSGTARHRSTTVINQFDLGRWLKHRRINGHRTRISRTVESLAGSRRLNESTYVQRYTVGLGSACWTVGARSHSSQGSSSATGRFSGRIARSGRLTARRFRSRVGSRSPPTSTEVVWRSVAW